MTNKYNKDKVLQNISGSIEKIDQTTNELVKVMDEQIDAIISSDAEKVEQLTERHAFLVNQFEKQESDMFAALKLAIGKGIGNEEKMKLDALKEIYPQTEAKIDGWKTLIAQNARKIQRKHEQLLGLLEFALDRNESMISMIYRMFSEQNTYYGAKGKEAGSTSGLAINQEI